MVLRINGQISIIGEILIARCSTWGRYAMRYAGRLFCRGRDALDPLQMLHSQMPPA
jgi:hypothetical protein